MKTKSLIVKITTCVLVAVLGICLFSSPAFACTGVYVGSDVSSDGTTLIARSNDTTPLNKPAVFKVYGGQDGKKLSQIVGSNGFTWDIPDKTYRTICTPSALSTDVTSSKSAINECGVSVSATVTGYSSSDSLKVNNYVEDGVNEGSIPILVGLTCSSAKEGVNLLAKVIDEKGSAEDNILMISDQNEAWYIEIYGGHQYCAVKAPSDCVAVIGNEFMIETVDQNSPDVVCSKGLFSVPQQNGFAVYNSDGKMNIFNSYVGTNRFLDYSHLRTWRGHQLLAPSTAGNYSVTTKYPLFFKPDSKVDVTKVMDIYRDRYEGTQYDINVNGENTARAISTETSQTTQILQTYKDVPSKFCIVNWCAFANAEFNVFAPFSNIESNFDDSYTYSSEDYYNVDLRNAFVAYKQLNALTSQNRLMLGDGVKEYWDFMESYASWALHDAVNSASNDEPSAQNILNETCRNIQNQCYYDAKRMFEDVNWHLMSIQETYAYSSSFKSLSVKERKHDAFSPYIDVALLAKIYGWNIEENKLQTHSGNGSEFDGNVISDPLQDPAKDQEGYIKITKDENTIEVHTNNGHRNSCGELIINGNAEKTSAKLYDGKCYIDFSFLKKIQSLSGDDSFKQISSTDLSSNNNLNNFFIPVWVYVIATLVVVVVAIILIRFFRKK